MAFIDLHAHILPGLDDGPETLEESIKMGKMALDQGICKVVATPHVTEGVFDNEKDVILEKTRELQEALKEEGIPLEVIPGAEIHISDNIISLLEQDKLLTINNAGKYILLELPHYQPIPLYLETLIFTLSLKGIRVIIPHPERNSSIQENPNILIPLINQGVLVQGTFSSLIGHFGERAQRTVVLLLRKRMIHLLSTDMHSVGGRLKYFTRALKKTEELLGKEVVCPMVTSVPELIIKNGEVKTSEPQLCQAKNSKGFIRSFLQRLYPPGVQDKNSGM